MIFFGFHGALDAEKELGQRFIVDVRLSLDLHAAGAGDDLQQTVHYGEVYRLVREIVEGPPANLIEAVAERVASAILATFTPVAVVEVTVKKPEVPIRGVLDYAAVQIVRRRSGHPTDPPL